MKFCNSCGACVGDDILECPHCGSEEMVDELIKKPEEEPAEKVKEPVANDEDNEESVEEASAEDVAEESDTESGETDVEDTEEGNSDESEESDENNTDEADEEAVEEDSTDATDEASADEGAEGDESAEESDEATEENTSENGGNEESEQGSSLAEYENKGETDKVDDTPVDPEAEAAKAARKKKIGIIAGSVLGAVVVIVGVICLFTFVDFDRNYAYDLEEKTFIADENVTGETVAAIPFVSNPPYEMSESFTDYQLNINGAVYQVPMPVQEIINSGWAFGNGEDGEAKLTSGQTAETYFVSKDGAVMYATLINFNSIDTARKECYVSSLKVDYTDNLLINIHMTGNLAIGRATKAQVEELIGESSDVVELGRGTVVTYKNSDTQSAQLTFNKKTLVLESIKYTNSKKPYNYQETTLEATTNQFGGTEQLDPEVLGTDITSGIVQIEGDIYKLPITVSDFLENGWEISYKEDIAVLAPDQHIMATLTREEKTITGVDVCNSTKEEKLIRNCTVIEVSSSPDDEYEVLYPNNLKVGMKEAEFKGIIQGLEYEFNEVNFDEYVFTNGAYMLMVVVDKDESAVNYISLTYDKELLNK